MRRVADTVPEELCVCVYPALWSRQWIIFFGSGSTVLITDVLSPYVHYKDNAFEMQAPASERHNFTATYLVILNNISYSLSWIRESWMYWYWSLNTHLYLLVFSIQEEISAAQKTTNLIERSEDDWSWPPLTGIRNQVVQMFSLDAQCTLLCCSNHCLNRTRCLTF